MIDKMLRIASDYFSTVRADPGQIKYTARWLVMRKRSTVELRMPWVPFRLIDAMSSHIGEDSRVAEFGGGGSTLWFSDRVAEVVTVEHDPEWHPVLERCLTDVPNSTLLFRSAAEGYAGYVSALDEYPDGYFDMIVVDGRERVRCFNASLQKVRPGGLIVLDDTERPRYSVAFRSIDWSHITYRGLTPTQTRLGQSTAWRKPSL